MASITEKSNSEINYSFSRSAEVSRARRANHEARKKGKNRLLGSVAILLATGALLVGVAGKSLAGSGDNPNKNPEKIEHVHKTKQEKQKKVEIPYAGYELSKSTEKQLKAQLPKIEELRSLYEQAAEKTNMPWYLIAAIHYEEANNDPNLSAFAGEALGSINPDGQGVNGYAPADQLQNYVAALKHARAMGEWVYGTEIDEETKDLSIIGKYLLAYNRGTIYEDAGLRPQDSPYVYSGLSKDGKEYSCIFPDADPLAGRLDQRPGALAVIIYLTRAYEAKQKIEDFIDTH
jgi:lysozyme family protein